MAELKDGFNDAMDVWQQKERVKSNTIEDLMFLDYMIDMLIELEEMVKDEDGRCRKTIK